jgi:threonine aldolase
MLMPFEVVSLGGTKNALMFGEAVVFPHGLPSADFRFLRKQYMQLPSKTRFVAAQFLEFLGTDLWLENARHANAMAQRLSKGLAASQYATLTQTTQANGCFAILPRKLVSKLREHYFFYVWDEHTFECRLMTSFDTTPDDVDGFLSQLEKLGAENA